VISSGVTPSARVGTPLRSDVVPPAGAEPQDRYPKLIEVGSDKKCPSRPQKYADMGGDSFERLVARWRAVRSVASVDRVWDGGAGDDVSVEAGRSEREVGRGCLWPTLAPPWRNGADDEQRIPA
jgi:hypothetical protein